MTAPARHDQRRDPVTSASESLHAITEQLRACEDPDEIATTLAELFLAPGPAHRLALLVREAGIALHRSTLPDRQFLAAELIAASGVLTTAVLRVGELGGVVEEAASEQWSRSRAATASSPGIDAVQGGPVAQGTGPVRHRPADAHPQR